MNQEEIREMRRKEIQQKKLEEFNIRYEFYLKFKEDPVWAILELVWWFLCLSLIIAVIFFIFRFIWICTIPKSFCDIEYDWTYFKKCYACSLKWLFFMETLKDDSIQPRTPSKILSEEDILLENWDNTGDNFYLDE